jgi:tripartite-type tricarboxylate transporter receptor subunit TctC
MNLHARLLLSVIALAFAGGISSVHAEEYPSKPIRLILPFAAGGGADTVARIVAPSLADKLGQSVVVDNRPGAGATIGTELGARAIPDGYTLLIASSTPLSVNPVLMKVRYDPEKDFEPITLLGTQPHIVVLHPSVPAKTLNEFVVLARGKPGAFHYSSSGNGGPTHLGCELFKIAAGIDLVHVPYKGQAAGVLSLISGEVQFSIPSAASVMPHVRSGRLRPLAATSAKRMRIAPELITVSEAGYPGFEVSSWTGLFARAKTPRSIIIKLQETVAQVVRQPDVLSRFAADNVEPGGNSSEVFTAYVKNDIAKWARVVKTAGIHVD